MRIGFVGTGNMGNGMVRKLLSAGHQVTVHDRRQETTANLIELGATWAPSAAALARESGLLFTSLPGPAEVDEVVLDDSGLLEGASEGMIHVDLTSNLPSSVRRLEHIEASRGVTFLEAPVSGMISGVTSVDEASLTAFAAGDERAFLINIWRDESRNQCIELTHRKRTASLWPLQGPRPGRRRHVRAYRTRDQP
jgi:3-hydroxyisobutyrate dehydrogenase